VECTYQHAGFQPSSSCKLLQTRWKASLGGVSHQLPSLVGPFLSPRLSVYNSDGKAINLHPLSSPVRKRHANENTCLGWNCILHYFLHSWNHVFFRNLCSSNRRKSPYVVLFEVVYPEHGDHLLDTSSQHSVRYLSGCRPHSRGGESTNFSGKENQDLLTLHAWNIVSQPPSIPTSFDTTSLLYCYIEDVSVEL